MKISFYIIVFMLAFCVNNTALADCYTGFACSIADLEKQEDIKTKNNISIFKRYLEKIDKSRRFYIIGNAGTEYNDLFIFYSIF